MSLFALVKREKSDEFGNDQRNKSATNLSKHYRLSVSFSGE